MDGKYPFAFGFLESAVHRALRELSDSWPSKAEIILRGALRDLQFNHGMELHWPDDVKERTDV